MDNALSARHVAGVTLIEMLVVIIIVSILTALGSSAYRSVTNSNRIAAEINSLLGTLQYGRYEAIREGQPVTICVSTDGSSCTGGTAWQGGWIAFADANGNGVVDTGEAVLRVQPPFSSTDTFTASNSVSAITFNREGFAAGIANGTLVTLHDYTSNSTWTRCLSITLVGVMNSMVAGASVNGNSCT
ncbi:MAG TPA: GspH/FimT family pseudopilin [Steroidobacteraceae bacterium]|nr:GspH/FimT family pseudopilin [Steroidobacteraceae bacterium]